MYICITTLSILYFFHERWARKVIELLTICAVPNSEKLENLSDLIELFHPLFLAEEDRPLMPVSQIWTGNYFPVNKSITLHHNYPQLFLSEVNWRGDSGEKCSSRSQSSFKCTNIKCYILRLFLGMAQSIKWGLFFKSPGSMDLCQATCCLQVTCI